MERVFPKSGDQPNKMALTICNLISRYFLLTRDWKPGILPNGKEISAVPFRKEKALPLEVVYNFRTDFPENCCSISLSTEVSVFFLLMVSTKSVRKLSSRNFLQVMYAQTLTKMVVFWILLTRTIKLDELKISTNTKFTFYFINVSKIF